MKIDLTVKALAIFYVVVFSLITVVSNTKAQVRRNARVISVANGSVIPLGEGRIAGLSCFSSYCFVVVEDK